MRRDKAIVTLALGERHHRLWQQHARPSWERYAARLGYDLVVLEQPLDASPRAAARSPAWQKLLILQQPFARDYERIVWLDSDIAIHAAAPCVVAGVPAERVGGVDEFAHPDLESNQRARRTIHRVGEGRGGSFELNLSASDFYRAHGFQAGMEEVVNTGVLVLSPAHHAELLAQVYHRYESRPGDSLEEMRPLSYELCKAGLVHQLDGRFNVLWEIYRVLHFPFLLRYPDHPAAAACVSQALTDSFFLHFAGVHGDIVHADVLSPAPARRARPPRPSAAAVVPRCEVPVALVLFNRPETTARVMEAIRQARPERLFLIADGPRNQDDLPRCAAARAVAERVDWECEVVRDYAETNLGLLRRFESGLDRLFEAVDEAIILEDDCLPDATFFRFCQELLERHREDTSIMSIAGSDFRFGMIGNDSSYAASRYPLVWGWATWRRAWRLRDLSMRAWPEALRSGWVHDSFPDRHQADYWAFVLQDAYERQYTWDYPWAFSCWRNGGLALHPNVNLVANIGFGAAATNTSDGRDAFADLPIEPMTFPLRHPATLDPDPAGETLIEQNVYSGAMLHLWARLRWHRRRQRRDPPGGE